ncbi:MAG: hypothetical protein DI537_13965 [Stutzerimonas stutzeri]|nr:MAG: hypothetical protein DI537_13965 [Stutzerimonas stutzeri]
MNIQITYEPAFDQIVCKVPVDEVGSKKLFDAVKTGALKPGYYAEEWLSEGETFTDALVEVDGEQVYLYAHDEEGTVRISVSARNLNGLDHTSFKPDIDGSWTDFIKPLRRVLEILQ